MTDQGRAFGAVLEEARATKGLSYKQVERAVVHLLGPMAPTHETIRQWHLGKMPPERADIFVAAALADVYGKRLSELSEVIAERYDSVADLLIRTKRCLAA